jgi:hypothetical protein
VKTHVKQYSQDEMLPLEGSFLSIKIQSIYLPTGCCQRFIFSVQLPILNFFSPSNAVSEEFSYLKHIEKLSAAQLRFAHRVQLRVSFDFHNKQRLFPYAALNERQLTMALRKPLVSIFFARMWEG